MNPWMANRRKPHRNQWTGRSCNCPWGGKHLSRSRQASWKFSGDNLNRVLKAPDKALRTPEGEEFKEHLRLLDPEYDSLTPFLAQRFKKGEISVGPHWNDPQGPALERLQRMNE